ncbi:MAG: glycerophosphodiester phosphodiesterase, partial [Asgard group archaeon]|nr:glycerophosphodiester phosphodiesterase [Asgard group archaeon]
KGLVKELLKLLNNYNCQKNCIISSFDKQPLINLKESQMKVDSALLFWKPIFYIRKTKQNLGINSLHPHYRLSTKNFLKRAKKANLKVRVWTVDNEKRIKRLIKMGIDGLITNNPLKAITYIED